MSGRAVFSAGASAHSVATAIATPPVNSSTVQSSGTLVGIGTDGGRSSARPRSAQRPSPNPTRRGGNGHQRRFNRQLTRDRRTARAQRGAQRDFLLPIHRPRQQQMTDVDARDQQHDADRREQQQQCRPRRTDDRFVRRFDRRSSGPAGLWDPRQAAACR